MGYIICWTNITNKKNIKYLFLKKYKQVIYSILATELYKKIYKFDI